MPVRSAHEDEDEEAEEEQVLKIKIPRVQTNLGKEVLFFKLPNFLSVEPRWVTCLSFFGICIRNTSNVHSKWYKDRLVLRPTRRRIRTEKRWTKKETHAYASRLLTLYVASTRRRPKAKSSNAAMRAWFDGQMAGRCALVKFMIDVKINQMAYQAIKIFDCFERISNSFHQSWMRLFSSFQVKKEHSASRQKMDCDRMDLKRWIIKFQLIL